MSGAGRGEPRGSYRPDGTQAARSFYAQRGTETGAQAPADVLAPFLADPMPQMDAHGRRVGGRHGMRGAGRFGASWNRADHEAIHGEIGGDAE